MRGVEHCCREGGPRSRGERCLEKWNEERHGGQRWPCRCSDVGIGIDDGHGSQGEEEGGQADLIRPGRW